jgi:hypothetical protein
MATTTDTVKIITNDGGWQYRVGPLAYAPDDGLQIDYRNVATDEWSLQLTMPHDDARAIAFAILSLLGEMPPNA